MKWEIIKRECFIFVTHLFFRWVVFGFIFLTVIMSAITLASDPAFVVINETTSRQRDSFVNPSDVFDVVMVFNASQTIYYIGSTINKTETHSITSGVIPMMRALRVDTRYIFISDILSLLSLFAGLIATSLFVIGRDNNVHIVRKIYIGNANYYSAKAIIALVVTLFFAIVFSNISYIFFSKLILSTTVPILAYSILGFLVARFSKNTFLPLIAVIALWVVDTRYILSLSFLPLQMAFGALKNIL